MAKFFLITIFLMTVFTSRSAHADTLALVADDRCPYHCASGSEHEGVMVDLARLIFEQAGHQIVYKNVSSAEAVEGVRAGQYIGVMGVTRDQVPDFTYPALPAIESAVGFYVLSSNPWQYDELRSLADNSVGIIESYSYGSELDPYLKENAGDFDRVQIVEGEKALERNVKKLLAGRVDVVIEDVAVMSSYLKAQQLEGQIILAGKTKPQGLYIAFAPENSAALNYAKNFEDGLSSMRRTGRYNMLLKLYGMESPK